MKWEELPMASRARLMAAAIRNGYTDIRSIKEAYANYQDLKLTTGNRYDEGGEFEVVNLLDDVPVEYDTEDTGYTPWFIQNTEHAPDNPMTNQQYYSLMEKVATENNPIWNTYRKEEGLPELTVDEEYTRILNDNSYDYRGYYNDPAVRNSNDNANTHWPDEYKTAYHPTFSTYSLYSGMVDPNYNPTGKNGGLWFGDNYVNYNKNAYGGNLFNNGGTKNLNVGGVKGLLNLFDKYHIPYKQTSGLRKGAKTASGHASYHSMTDVWGNPRAVDITGDFNKIKEMAYSNPEIMAYMRKEGLGILEETTSDVKKKTHATGDHFHIGPDKWAIQMRDNNINKYNVTYHPMQDVTWANVQARKQLFELTPEEETLLNTSALGTYNPEYVDRNDPNYRSALADAVALDESLDKPLDTPANNWAKWNAFLSMQSDQSDPVSSYSAIQQKEEPSLYQLFAPQGDDYMYHGLNFAAYGGKVNRFDNGGRTITIGELPEAYVRAHGNMSVVTPAGNRTTLSDAYKNYNQTPVNTNDVPGLTDYLIKQDQPDISEQAYLDKVAADREIRQRNNIINGPIFDKEKIYNRVPGDMWQAVISDKNNQSVEANRGIIKSLLGYYFNPDNAVKSRLQRYEKYKDLSMEEVMNAGIEFDRMWNEYGLDSIHNNPILSRKMTELESKMRAPHILQHEDAKAIYLGLPQRNNTMKDAEYSPTNGNLRNGKYISYMRDPAFVNDVIMKSYNDLKYGFIDKETTHPGLYKDHVYSKRLTPVKEITPRGYARVEFPFLNNATLSGGIDPQRGEYASIFDTWDYNTNIMGTPGDNVGKYIGGEPFDIYDRYYLDDYYGINSKPQDNGYYGGYLPELFIVNKKTLGGHLFSDGGFSDLPEQRAYRRAVNLKAPYTNYEDAIDMDDSIMLRLKKFFDKGVSNCTLTASQLFNPDNPIGRARTIVNDSINNGFYEIDADHVVPGTMVIASHPEMSDYNPEQNYHTMVVTGFAPNDYEYTFRDGSKYQIKKGEPLVSYSRGKASADNYVHDVPLSVYNANSEGKTYNRYYRPIDENYPQVMIPEITITR